MAEDKPATLTYANTLRVVEGGVIKSLVSGSTNQLAGLKELLNGPMAGRAYSKPAPASGWRPVGGDSRCHAPGAEPGGSRAATAEVGAGRARVSETEPQVAAGAGLGQSSGGECCPRDPPKIPWPSQPLMHTETGSPGGHWGQRRGGARGMANWGWGAERWAPRPPSGHRRQPLEGDRNPSTRPASPGLEPERAGGWL